MGEPKVCTFGPTLTPRFPLKMAEIVKNIGLPKNVKIKALFFLLFLRKT